MLRWLLLLGGPLIWGAHFLLVYAIASISEVAAGETTLTARALIGLSGGLAATGCLGVLFLGLRHRGGEAVDAFWRTVSATGAALGFVGVLWQTLPALIGLPGF